MEILSCEYTLLFLKRYETYASTCVRVCVYDKIARQSIHAHVALPDAGSERANGRGGVNALRLLQPEVQ
jgi:chemotaxis receptor (MCP) glutamine deamidase CheD